MSSALVYTCSSSEISINAGQIQECSDELTNAMDGLDEDIFTLSYPEFPGIPTQMHADIASTFQKALATLSRGVKHDAKALIAAKDSFVQADIKSAHAIQDMGR